MRTLAEIQRAHDMLVGFILDEVPEDMRVSKEDKDKFSGLACVLCWVLHHEHNDRFAKLLTSIEDWVTSKGVVLEKREPEKEQ